MDNNKPSAKLEFSRLLKKVISQSKKRSSCLVCVEMLLKEEAEVSYIKSCSQGEIGNVLRIGVIALSSTDCDSDIWRYQILSEHKSKLVQFAIQ